MVKQTVFYNSRDALILFCIFLVAFIVRVWGINFGLPFLLSRPDEEILVESFLLPFQNFHPATFNYPSLHKYVLCVFYWGFGYVQNLLGLSPTHSMLLRFIDTPNFFFLIGRYVSAVIGSLSVFVVYRIGKSIFSRAVGLISALLLSIAYLHVRDSHFGTVDVTATFFVLVSLVYICKLNDSKDTSCYVWAGVYTGIAASCKYFGFILFIPVLLLAIFNIVHDKNLIWHVGKKMSIFFLTSLAVFLVTSPYIVFDFRSFAQDVLLEWHHLVGGHNGAQLGAGWIYHGTFSLLWGLGPAFLFAAIGGLILVFLRQRRQAVIIFAFPVVYYCIAGLGKTVFVRYMVPMVPFMCLAAAYLCVFLFTTVRKKSTFFFSLFISGLFLIGVLTYSLTQVIFFDRVICKKDTRVLAADWIQRHVLEGSSVLQLNTHSRVIIYPHEIIDGCNNVFWSLFDQSGLENYKKKINYLRVFNFSRPTIDFIDYYRNEALPDYIIICESKLQYYDSVPSSLRKIVDTKYSPVATFFSAQRKDQGEDALYDQLDAFYVPYTRFEAVIRPGPDVYIYKKLSHAL